MKLLLLSFAFLLTSQSHATTTQNLLWSNAGANGYKTPYILKMTIANDQSIEGFSLDWTGYPYTSYPYNVNDIFENDGLVFIKDTYKIMGTIITTIVTGVSNVTFNLKTGGELDFYLLRRALPTKDYRKISVKIEKSNSVWKTFVKTDSGYKPYNYVLFTTRTLFGSAVGLKIANFYLLDTADLDPATLWDFAQQAENGYIPQISAKSKLVHVANSDNLTAF